MSKMKLTVIIAVAALILILGAAFTAIGIASYKPTIAFYNVSEKVQSAILSEMKTLNVGKKGKPVEYNVVVLNGDRPLSSQKEAGKAKMIFASADYDVLEYSKKAVSLNSSLLDGTPSTTRLTANMKDDKLFTVPLLYDFYQIDVDYQAFKDSSVKNINTWNDLMAFFKETATREFKPFVFSGSDPAELLNFLGCMTEASCGSAVLKETEDKLYSEYKKGNTEELIKVFETLLEDESALKPAIDAMRVLVEEKLINDSAFSFGKEDTLFFMSHYLCNSGILPLSEHRKIDYSAVNSYTSIYVPSTGSDSSRSFAAPTVCVLSQSKKDYVINTINLLATSRQSSLSTKSGLAPVQASCSVPDKQADDVRFWLAASNGPDMPLSGAIPDKDVRKVLADRLTVMLRYGM